LLSLGSIVIGGKHRDSHVGSRFQNHESIYLPRLTRVTIVVILQLMATVSQLTRQDYDG